MADAHEIVRMRFISELFFIDIVQGIVQKILEKAHVIEDEVFWMCLSVREATINSIKHGNRFDRSKYVEFGLEMRERRLRVEISDQGDGFNAEQVPNPLDEENLLKPSGRGIFYIRSFMDHVSFKRSNTGMTIVMEKEFTILEKEQHQ